MKQVICVLGALIASFQAVSQYDPAALNTLNAMSSKYKKMEAYSANFTQQMINKSAGLDEKIDGKILVKGNKYFLEIAGQKIYNDGVEVWKFDPEVQEVTVTTYEPEDQEITLGNVYDLYQEGFKYAIADQLKDGSKVIELDPEDRNKSYFKIRLTINPENELAQFEVLEKSGNRYVYKINDFQQMSQVPDNAFVFNPAKHPDVEVIDFR